MRVLFQEIECQRVRNMPGLLRCAWPFQGVAWGKNEFQLWTYATKDSYTFWQRTENKQDSTAGKEAGEANETCLTCFMNLEEDGNFQDIIRAVPIIWALARTSFHFRPRLKPNAYSRNVSSMRTLTPTWRALPSRPNHVFQKVQLIKLWPWPWRRLSVIFRHTHRRHQDTSYTPPPNFLSIF